jgi:transcriptional regulator with XRE-family HTH domain
VDSADPRLLLAQQLRALREDRWAGTKITQHQLARALGGDRPLSVPLISSWESQTSPRIPPLSRLEAYAALFATRRSLTRNGLRPIRWDDLGDDEQKAASELKGELLQLRNAAMEAEQAEQYAAEQAGARSAGAVRSGLSAGLLRAGPWRFEDEATITVVCAQWPDEMLHKIPYTDAADPDFIELLTYSELDSLFELFGHLRAVNPATHIIWRRADRVTNNDYTTHLVSLGGVDWNQATTSMLEELGLPVRQIADWTTPDGTFFEVGEGSRTAQHRPVLEKKDGRDVLREDVALFARAVNPLNQERTVTICNGMYGRGTYGVVRALTDRRFHERNARYLRSRFGSSRSYCLLTRVRIINNETVTPDWTIEANRLFEWSGGPDAGE